MESLHVVCELLSYRKEYHLADLLAEATLEFDIEISSLRFMDMTYSTPVAIVYAPIPAYEQLRSLPERSKGFILSTILEVWPNIFENHKLSQAKLNIRLVSNLPVAEPERDTLVSKRFEKPSVDKLPIDDAIRSVIQDRLDEAQLCFSSGAFLSVIFLCGSVLEAILWDAANKEPERFNRAQSSPKESDGKTKKFQAWSLSDFIDVASEVGPTEDRH